MAKRGGTRPGAGRKRDVSKDLAVGSSTALKLLKELNAEHALVDLFKNCGDARLKAQIIFRLREQAYGKPTQAVELGARGNEPIRVEVEFIGGDA